MLHDFQKELIIIETYLKIGRRLCIYLLNFLLILLIILSVHLFIQVLKIIFFIMNKDRAHFLCEDRVTIFYVLLEFRKVFFFDFLMLLWWLFLFLSTVFKSLFLFDIVSFPTLQFFLDFVEFKPCLALLIFYFSSAIPTNFSSMI